jgi:hypothetical protein
MWDAAEVIPAELVAANADYAKIALVEDAEV